MLEIEVKILEIDKNKTIQKIESLGAQKVFDGIIFAVYFDLPDNKLSAEKKTLRLRQKGNLAEITLKEIVPNDKAKIMDEYESPCEFNSMREILNHLGYKETRTIKKHRISYSYNKVHFEIDSYDGIPPLLEIEAPTLAKLEETVCGLGYTMQDTKPWGAKDVLAYYKKK